MSNPNQDERPASDALGLMGGWLWIMIGVGVPIFGSLKEWKGSLTLIAVGAAIIVPILWHERRQRAAQKPREAAGWMGGWSMIVIGIAFLGLGSLKEWKTPLIL